MSQQTHILNGLKVLDLTRALAGPSCTRMFAEMGATVVKVEAAPNGDMTRGDGSERSLYHIQQNLNKQSLCLNLRDPRGLALLKELVPHFDVVVENFRPGVMAGMGLGFDELKALRTDIVLCSISALGQTGPLSHKPGYDYIAQAYSGVTSMIGDPNEPPYIPCVGLGDVSTGVTAAAGILAALRHRDLTGRGQHIDVGLLDVYYHYHEFNVHAASASRGEIKPTRSGRHMQYLCPSGLFRGSDGCVMLMGFNQHWKDLCAAMERPDLLDDPIFGTDEARLQRIDETVELVEDWLQAHASIYDAIAKLEAAGVPCAPVLSVEETLEHPHFRARGTVRTIRDRIAGEFDIPGHPIRFSGFPNNVDWEAPALGEHNHSVLQTFLGKAKDEVDGLESEGILVSNEY